MIPAVCALVIKTEWHAWRMPFRKLCEGWPMGQLTQEPHLALVHFLKEPVVNSFQSFNPSPRNLPTIQTETKSPPRE